jgi:hypothetical protein
MYEELAAKLGRLVDSKQQQYGDSFHTFHHLLAFLYPDGVKVEDYPNMLAIVRVLDKLCRISRGDQGDESAWNDIAGYGILMSRGK